MDLRKALKSCFALRNDLLGYRIKQFEALCCWSDDAAGFPEACAFHPAYALQSFERSLAWSFEQVELLRT